MLSLTENQIRSLVASTNSRYFGIGFIKKKCTECKGELVFTNKDYFCSKCGKQDTGEYRKMCAQVGVTKYLKGGKLKYTPRNYSLKTVFDRNKQGYRMIPTDPKRIVYLKINGKEYK